MSDKPKIYNYKSLRSVVIRMRDDLRHNDNGGVDFVLLYAYNGTGKTRLSMEFKNAGKGKRGQDRDTLYFNAFTEDLFYWDNDLENDANRVLQIDSDSKFFEGFKELALEEKIFDYLKRYSNFDFKIDYDNWHVTFSKLVKNPRFRPDSSEPETVVQDNIKISRGEENLFVWCFFLAIVQLVLDKEEGSPYAWVQYIYIDDPISSLDDNNAIQVASHLAQLLRSSNNGIKTVISSHHALFFNVICNELKRGLKYMLCSHEGRVKYSLKDTSDTPFFHHVASLKKLAKAAKRNELYTYHFSMLRNILERSASFHGFNNLSDFIKHDKGDPDGVLHHRIIQLLNHGGYSHFEPQEMIEENKRHFKKILENFMNDYGFNPELFPDEQEETTA